MTPKEIQDAVIKLRESADDLIGKLYDELETETDPDRIDAYNIVLDGLCAGRNLIAETEHELPDYIF